MDFILVDLTLVDVILVDLARFELASASADGDRCLPCSLHHRPILDGSNRLPDDLIVALTG